MPLKTGEMMTTLMSENLDETRDAGTGRDPVTGRLLPGHRVSVGNKGGRPSNEVRNLFSAGDLQAAHERLMAIINNPKEKAMAQIQAIKLVLETIGGKPASADFAERIDGIEAKVETLLQRMSEQMEAVS
jgi:hypothetical protein